jgi:ribonucleotide reductase alpha subunit
MRNIRLGVYDKGIVEKYNKTEIKKLNTWIRRDRDLNFAYAGLRQVVDKYLVQDRSTGQLYETPQDMYMMIAATLFAEYPKNKRMSYVKRYYDAISQFKINIPTPVMAGVRTPIRQFASCVLVDSDDTLLLSSPLTWPLACMWHGELASVSTLAGSEASMPRSEAVRYSTQVWCRSSRNLRAP